VSASLPFHQRVKAWHLFDGDLPKTATRKVKRPLVREELVRLEAAALKGRKARESAREAHGGDGWLLDLLAEVSRRPRADIGKETRLAADLGFDSLMLTELAAALEEAGVPASAGDELPRVHTVGELARVVASARRRGPDRPAPVAPAAEEPREAEGEIPVPAALAALGRKVLGAGQRALYQDLYGARVVGEAFVPHDRNVLVVANHSSHLDMGLVKVAMGEEGGRLSALAAKDYFFDTPVKRAYFENFTNLIPMEREGALKASLRAAGEALRRGYHLLIFPEGTRSRDGEMGAFFPTAGYLALQNGVDVLPVHLAGTFEALPPGSTLPRKADLEVRFGQVIRVEDLRKRTAGLQRSDAYKAATDVMEQAVRALREAWREEAGRKGKREGAGAPAAPTPTPVPSPAATAAPPATPTPTGEAAHPERSSAAAAAERSRGAADPISAKGHRKP
jgi:long-chain acyl-CoA synthetase